MSLTDASLNAVASTSRLGACETCLLVPSRYTCPLCQHKTCSLPCSKRHKLVLACSGIALKVHQKDVKANEWNWGNLMRDQSYLSEVSRIIEGNGKELVSGQLLPSASSFGSRSSNDFAGGVGGMVGAPGGGRLDELSDKEARIVREAARSEGVRLVILPKGMSRRGRNATKWDQTAKRMDWTLEMALDSPVADAGKVTLTSKPQASNLQLVKILRTFFEMRDKKGKKFAEPTVDGGVPIVDGVRVVAVSRIASENTWLDGLDPQLPPSAESTSPSTTSTAPVPLTVYDAQTSAFILLLAVVELPPSEPTPESDDEEEGSLPPPPPPIAPSRSTAKSYYFLDPFSTLQESLRRTTILEFPTLHLFSRAEYDAEIESGRMEVVDKPVAEVVVSLGSSGFEGNRGGGRGRGGDRGRGGRGRGGRGGSSRGDSGGRENAGEGGARDNGWGKRAGPVGESTGEEKRARIEQ